MIRTMNRVSSDDPGLADPPAGYSPAQKWLHWLTAAIVLLAMIPAGLTMTRLGEGETTNRLYELHKSFGVIVFSLALVRAAIRLARGAPRYEPNIPRWQRVAAAASHYALYGLIFLVPITGWIATSSCCAPVNLFWTIPVTLPVPEGEAFAKAVFRLHYAFVYTLMAIVAVHAGAALQHHFIRRDRTLLRMLPGGRAAAEREPTPT
jgi:cytochrome b561